MNMTEEIITDGPNKGFEEIKEIDENGIEFWTARNLFPLLGYSRWETFDEVIIRAAKAALNSGQIIDNHFRQLTKLVEVGSGARRAIKDWKMDRYACYLIAQNGDSKRLFIRGEVTDENKKLFKTAKHAGVAHFGLFNDAGYRGLYGSSLAAVESKKGIRKGELLDRAGSSELAANLFRITQTDDKLKKDNIKGDIAAQRVHNMIGGKVRQTIKDIGGTLPEDLKPERHIKEIRKEIKLLNKQTKKIRLS